MNFDQRFCWIVRAASRKSLISQVLDFLVPAEGIEPPTFGLQNLLNLDIDVSSCACLTAITFIFRCS
jgi:hypothetical protein